MGDIVLVDGKHKFTVVSVNFSDGERECTAEAKGRIEHHSNEVEFLYMDQEIDLDEEEDETEEETQLGEAEDGEEQTSQTENKDADQEGKSWQEEQEEIRKKYEDRSEPWILDMFSFLNHVDSCDAAWIKTKGIALHINDQEFWGDVCACILDNKKDERLKFLGQIKSCDPEDIPRGLDIELRKSVDPAWHMNYDLPDQCEKL